MQQEPQEMEAAAPPAEEAAPGPAASNPNRLSCVCNKEEAQAVRALARVRKVEIAVILREFTLRQAVEEAQALRDLLGG